MAKKQITPAIGAAFEGGFYSGDIVVAGVRYALVVDPKAEGEKIGLQYKVKARDVFDGTDSEDDGLANTERINDVNHPAAQFCRGLQIGGFNDWYLPSRDELMRIWMALGPNRKKTPDLFKAGGRESFESRWYWASTEPAQYSSYAWVVDFYDGYQHTSLKSNNCGVRAVRRVKI